MANQLAIDGGTPVRTAAWPPWPHFDEDDVAAAAAVLHSGKVNYWTGTAGREFEGAFAEYVDAEHALSVANGTVALELALTSLGIGEGDDVVVPARTFIATAGAIATRGARPIVADIDPDTQNMTPETILEALTPDTKAIIVVHLGGWPADMPAIMELAAARDLLVIEDCAQALGARIDGRAVGAFGDAGAFSFCQDKILTTAGEGGMLVTANTAVFKTAWSLRDHGKGYDTVHNDTTTGGVEFRWLTDTFGSNGRMTEIQSAIGLTTLAKLPAWLETRRAHAAQLDACLGQLGALRVPVPSPEVEHAYYKYYAFVREDALREGWDRSRIAHAENAEGVPCFTGSCPEIYREKAWGRFGDVARLPVAQKLGETSLMFTVHPTLGEREIEDTCAAVTKVLSEATRP
jgi:dTDP-4-amino-4,6-dideoxygalactose transaminase